jgi:replication factor A2
MQSVTPLTCKQLALASQPHSEGVFHVDGHELTQVTLVGQLHEVSEQSTNIVFRIDDGTGVVDARLWVDAASPVAEQRQAWSVGTYVRVYGHLRSYQGSRAVIALRVQPVLDYNEVTFHALQCIAAHLHNTRGPAAGTGTGTGRATGSGDVLMTTASASATAMTMVTSASMFPSNVHHMVYEVVRGNQTERGEGVVEIVQKLKGAADEPRIRDALAFLSSEGHIYTTVDEDHFKAV